MRWPFVSRREYETLAANSTISLLSTQSKLQEARKERDDALHQAQELHDAEAKLFNTNLNLSRAKSTVESLLQTAEESVDRQSAQLQALESERAQLIETVESLGTLVVTGEQQVYQLQGDYDKLSDRFQTLSNMHTDRIRVGSITLDPFELTARLHRIEPSLKAEYDGKRIVIYGDRRLESSEMNALKSTLAPDLNPT